jgi:hypothetical protein
MFETRANTVNLLINNRMILNPNVQFYPCWLQNRPYQLTRRSPAYASHHGIEGRFIQIL